MKLTITSDEGVVYDTFTVDEKHPRLGWLVTDSTDEQNGIDEVLDDAARWDAAEKLA